MKDNTTIELLWVNVSALEASIRRYKGEDFEELLEGTIDAVKRVKAPPGKADHLILPLQVIHEVLLEERGQRFKLTQVELIVEAVRVFQGVIFDTCQLNLERDSETGEFREASWLPEAAILQIDLLRLGKTYLHDVRELSTIDNALDVDYFYSLDCTLQRTAVIAGILGNDVQSAEELSNLLDDQFMMTHAYRCAAPLVTLSALDEVALAFKLSGRPVNPRAAAMIEIRDDVRKG